MPPKVKANKSERKKINEMRDKMIKDLQDKGVTPMYKPSGSLQFESRSFKNMLRDSKLMTVRKRQGIGRGRPKKAITTFREGLYKF